MTAWESPDYGPLINHLQALRRQGRVPRGRDATTGRGCGGCRGLQRTILVDGEHRIVYSEPCLACRGGGTTEKADIPA